MDLFLPIALGLTFLGGMCASRIFASKRHSLFAAFAAFVLSLLIVYFVSFCIVFVLVAASGSVDMDAARANPSALLQLILDETFEVAGLALFTMLLVFVVRIFRTLRVGKQDRSG